MTTATETACIRRAYLGGSDDVTFDQFAEIVVQDYACAAEVAETMLNDDPRPYQWNADEPEFYEEFAVIDAAELRRCLDTYATDDEGSAR